MRDALERFLTELTTQRRASPHTVLAYRRDLVHVLDFAADKFAEARRSPEAAEGLRAFAEKRPPKWATE